MIEILHLSDLHFGEPFLPERARAARELAERRRPDLVVVSGDLTQRAREREFEAAAAFLDALEPPVAVTPGNHDVPLYRVWERVFSPYRHYRRHVSGELDAVHRLDGLTVVCLNSSRRFTLDNGRLRSDQLEFAEEAFGAAPPADLKALVTHHHLAPPPDLESRHSVMPGARRALRRLTDAGVHLVMAGHMHRSYIGDSLDFFPDDSRDRSVVIVQCGTTASRRGHGRESQRNSLNVIRADTEELFVTHYLWRRSAGAFHPHSEHRFGVRPDPWLSEEKLTDAAGTAGDGSDPGGDGDDRQAPGREASHGAGAGERPASARERDNR